MPRRSLCLARLAAVLLCFAACTSSPADSGNPADSATDTDTDTGEVRDTQQPDDECITCYDFFFGSVDHATFEPDDFCPNSADIYEAFATCVCTECSTECGEYCNSGSSECVDCQTDAIDTTCASQASACESDA